ncbi:protein NEGATIVE REGULATOR OF RESISTANCE-like [Lolium rigidum]|uniref:protein NEGATIVE REGULATOR OF RESISTANCE-like n=1 Tax=Lolium rigidum TaxID=89674 RepID=UPI001F5D2C1C|nr:protein NEGATIVE REGULATOR OF RESISTANCE-like [Lolium rigidum]
MDAPTATGKRKRPAAEEVSDAEVEEFSVILRRMRDATRRFVSRGSAGARAPSSWHPSFWEDLAPAAQPAPTQPQRPSVDARLTEDAKPPPRPSGIFLDLNAEPEPEAPATP